MSQRIAIRAHHAVDHRSKTIVRRDREHERAIAPVQHGSVWIDGIERACVCASDGKFFSPDSRREPEQNVAIDLPAATHARAGEMSLTQSDAPR